MTMATDAIANLYDEVLDYAAERAMRNRGTSPKWSVLIEDRPRGYGIMITFDAELVVDVFSRDLEQCARRALTAFDGWRSQQADEIEHALVVSIAEARAERAAGLQR
jgi:hypothetical protein